MPAGSGVSFLRRPDGTAASEFADVRHHHLTPARDEANKWASVCPLCKEGLLLVIREPATFHLQEMDCCTLCGKRFKYEDIAEMRMKDWAR